MSIKSTKISLRPILLVALIGFFLFVPEPAQALLGFSVTDLVTGVFRTIAFIFNFIGGVLFTLAGMLVNLMLSLNLSVLDDSNTLVHVGWRIVRDIANLGFVLVIIVIAFATILRFEQYGVTKLLPKLIAAAIIVNFSFAIASALINFTHVLTNFFAARTLSSSTLGPWDLSASLADAFGPQRFIIETDPSPPNPEEDVGGLTEFSTAVLTSITALFFVVIFTFIGAFVLLAFAFMLLLRYLYLTFLVILAPLVWLFWVVPDLVGQWNKWWNKFLQWAFFAPAVMFFVYLALVSIEGLGDIGFQLKNTGGGIGGFFTGVLQNTMIQGAQMVVLSGILIGGLIIAQKMGIWGAKGSIELGKRFRDAGLHYSGQVGTYAGAAALNSRAGRAVTGGMQRAGTALGGFGAGWGRFGRFVTAPLRGTGRAIGGAGTAAAGFATAPRPAPSLWNSLQRHVFRQRQWVCNVDGTVVGPSRRPPNRCPTPTCPSNIPGSGVTVSWRIL